MVCALTCQDLSCAAPLYSLLLLKHMWSAMYNGELQLNYTAFRFCNSQRWHEPSRCSAPSLCFAPF
eukprot:7044-Heterococcus_DN1.PRE.2